MLPRHVMWATEARGDLYVTEARDSEVGRVVRVAVLRDKENKPLIEPLHDVQLISAKPDWWTMTGWERLEGGAGVSQRAYQQSWILIPADKASQAG